MIRLDDIGLIGLPTCGKRFCSVGAQGHKDKSQGKTDSTSRTAFPYDFLTDYERLFGRGFTTQDIVNAVPKTPGLFDPRSATPTPGPAASPTTTPAPAAPAGPGLGFTPTPYAPAPAAANVAATAERAVSGDASLADAQRAYNTAQATTQPSTGGTFDTNPAGAQPANPGHVVSPGDIYRLASSLYGGSKDPTLITGTIRQEIKNLGFDPDGPVPESVVLRAFSGAEGQFRGGGASRNRGEVAANVLPGILSNYFELRDARNAPNLPTATAPQVGIDVPGGVQRLGFGETPTTVAGDVPGMIREAPTITTPDVGNAQMNIAPEGFKKYGEDIFQSLYNPVAREERRAGQIQDRQLQAELANAGIASSGAGFGQLQTQRNERQQRIFAAAQDAASRASVERFGKEFDQNQRNAELTQQQNLTRAGLDLQGQTENAANVLRGDTARSAAYLQAIGLDDARAKDARADFLALAGLQEQDLARLDAAAQTRLETAMNGWLQQFAALSNAGQISQSAGKTSGKNAGGGVQVYGSGGSGGE